MGRRVAALWAFIAIALMQMSCADVIEMDRENLPDDQIVLGEKLDNPFTLANMQQAMLTLKQSNPETFSSLPDHLESTHYYVRFLPKDETQLDRLLGDSTIRTSDYPVEYKIEKEGTFYHDPNLSDTEFTYLYAAVPVDYVFPAGIDYEKLEELYLPEVARILDIGARSLTNISEIIEEEAFRQIGIAPEDADGRETTSARHNSKWTPSGRVTVWDDRLNKFIPLAGVKVQSRRWFYVKEAITDDDGCFKMSDDVRGEVRYRLLFERKHFDIRSGTFGQAKIEGPKRKGDWNVEIQDNSIAFHYAHTFRAAMRYFYGEVDGLTRPTFRLKYSVFDKRGSHAARNIGNWSMFGINPNILLYRYASSDGHEYQADEMFSNTCHETAHATHMQMMNGGMIQFLQVSETIRESWAVGVEWFITQLEYKEKGIANYGDPGFSVKVGYPAFHGFPYWNKSRGDTFTSLFIDLVDVNNQRGQNFGYTRVGTINDPVTGYTFAEIENEFLKNVYGIESLSEELKKNKPIELRDQDIEVLLKYF